MKYYLYDDTYNQIMFAVDENKKVYRYDRDANMFVNTLIEYDPRWDYISPLIYPITEARVNHLKEKWATD